MFYLRPDEKRPPSTGTVGVLVTDAAGRRLFFPGGDAKTALILAGLTLSRDELAAADKIEFGERANGGFVRHELIQDRTPPPNPYTHRR